MLKKIKLFFLVFLLIGCSPQPPATHPRVLRMNICRDPPTLDPRAGGDLASSAIHFLLFEGLMRLKADGTVVPAQASHVDISDDQLTYTFHLRATHWSDGSVVKAQDFEYAWKKILSPQFAAPNAYLFYVIKNGEKVKKGEAREDELGVYTIDDLTLIIELERPTPYFLNLVSFCAFFPVPSTTDLANPHWMYEASSDFICNGPFRLAKWKHHQELVLEKSNHYWEAQDIDLEQIVVSMIADENTALSLFEKGELDIIGRGFSPIPIDAIARYKAEGSLKIYRYPGTTAICFNVHRFPFNNVNIRKAFSYAIDRSQIVQNMTSLGEEIATNINSFEPQSLFEDHMIASAQKHLEIGLQELGISLKGFPKVALDYSFSDMNRKLAQVLQENWMKTLNIPIRLSSCEHKVLLDRFISKSYDFAQTIWMAQFNDPISILERFKFKDSSKNYSGWENEDYIRLLDESAYAKTPEERKEILAQAEALLIEEMPLTPLYHWKGAFMIKDHLTYEEFAPTGAFDYARIRVKN